MTYRLATRLGLPAPEDRLPGALDLAKAMGARRFQQRSAASLERLRGGARR